MKASLGGTSYQKKDTLKVEDINYILRDDNEEIPYEDYESAVRILWGQITDQSNKNKENKYLSILKNKKQK